MTQLVREWLKKTDTVRKIFDLAVVLLLVTVVLVVASGRSLRGVIGGNEIVINSIENNIVSLQQEMAQMKDSFEKELSQVRKNLAFHAVWEKDKVIADSAFYRSLAEQLYKQTEASAVTIWLLGHPLERGDRYMLASVPDSTAEIIGAKASKGWAESPWRAESINLGRHVAVVEGVPEFNEHDLMGIVSNIPYTVHNGTPTLSAKFGKSELDWNDDLGNMVTYTTGKIGIKPVIYIAIDYKVKTEADAKMYMRKTLDYVPRILEICLERALKTNPAVIDLEYLSWGFNVKELPK